MKKIQKNILRFTLFTVIAAGVFAGIFWVILDKDEINMDINKMRTTISMAMSMNMRVSFHSGYIMVHPPSGNPGSQIEVPTLVSADTTDEGRIIIHFKSVFFRDTVNLDITIRPVKVPGRIDEM